VQCRSAEPMYVWLGGAARHPLAIRPRKIARPAPGFRRAIRWSFVKRAGESVVIRDCKPSPGSPPQCPHQAFWCRLALPPGPWPTLSPPKALLYSPGDMAFVIPICYTQPTEFGTQPTEFDHRPESAATRVPRGRPR
jgi:hypothetical protein